MLTAAPIAGATDQAVTVENALCFAVSHPNVAFLFLRDIAAENAHCPVISRRPVRRHERRYPVIGVCDPRFGVPNFHAPIRAFAVRPLPERRERIEALIVDAGEIEQRQKFVAAVAEQFVYRVGGGITAADQQIRAVVSSALPKPPPPFCGTSRGSAAYPRPSRKSRCPPRVRSTAKRR